MTLVKRMAGSRLALPFMILYSAALWTVRLLADPSQWPAFVIFFINVALMAELNNRNALIRQYSRMVSCSYIAVMMMWSSLLADVQTMALQFCVIMAFSLIFTTYQKRHDMGHKYWAYLFLGVAAIIWPPVLFLLPLFWIGEAAFLMSFSWKGFCASLLGILTPAWILLPLVFFPGTNAIITDRLAQYVSDGKAAQLFSSLQNMLPVSIGADTIQLSLAAFMSVMLLIGVVHYYRQSYRDKIQVRMLYNYFVLTAFFTLLVLAAAAISPLYSETAWHSSASILIVCVSPFVGHYVTFSSTRLTNIIFWIALSLAVVTAVLQLLIQNVQPLMTIL